MASTPEYTRKAVDNYRKKFDVMQLRLPKGTKEIIDNKVGKANAHNFIVECVLKALETPQDAHTEPIKTQMEETLQKAYKEPTTEEIQALQALIDEKRAKQKEQEEIVKKAQEQRKAEEKAKEAEEVNKIIDRIINSGELEEDEEKEKLRQESIIKSSLPY